MIGEGQAARLAGDSRAELAEACRQIIDELSSSSADGAAFAHARDLVQQAVDLLHALPHDRPYVGGESSLAMYRDRIFIDHSPFVGPLNPIAPPIVVAAEGTRVTGLVTYGKAFEGAPMCVHGGTVAAGFDEILGFSQGLTGQPGMTAYLNVQYRSPTPLQVPLRFSADVERVEGRKIYARGELRVVADDRLCADAEGLFITVNPEIFRPMMAKRERERERERDSDSERESERGRPGE
ncbi:MAG: PaaI family thioesterase [Actinomycetota bacterium]|nr:PaaI family thioesterase [Actinomycetota bacterium]